ncbi:Hypothetical protein, putative, partial [Bodo saltans]
MSLRPTSSSTRRGSLYNGAVTSSPPRTFLGTSDLIESLGRTVRDPSHLAATPSCMLQLRTQSSCVDSSSSGHGGSSTLPAAMPRVTTSSTTTGSSDLIESLGRPVRDPSHLAATPSCMLQLRTQSSCVDNSSSSGHGGSSTLPTVMPRVTTSSTTTGSRLSSSSHGGLVAGQIPCPRYDPVYAFRHKDGVQF